MSAACPPANGRFGSVEPARPSHRRTVAGADNTAWGYTRVQGALENAAYSIGRNTIERILKEQGLEPAPLRRRKYSWATFIDAHLSAIAAADFFTVEVLSWAGLVRYHVFVVIDLASRRV
jgi:putative transposase